MLTIPIAHTKYQRDALNIIYSSNILLYMFRVSSTHLQEDTVVCEQHMVPYAHVQLYPPEDEYLILETCRGEYLTNK